MAAKERVLQSNTCLRDANVNIKLEQIPEEFYLLGNNAVLVIYRFLGKSDAEGKLCVFDFRQATIDLVKKLAIAIKINLDLLYRIYKVKDFEAVLPKIAQSPEKLKSITKKKVNEQELWNRQDTLLDVFQKPANLKVFEMVSSTSYRYKNKQRQIFKNINYLELSPNTSPPSMLFSVNYFYANGFDGIFEVNNPCWSWKAVNTNEMILVVLTSKVNKVIIKNYLLKVCPQSYIEIGDTQSLKSVL